MNTFLASGDSRETSAALMQAILWVACGNEALAERIWEQPTETEVKGIWNRVTNNGELDAAEFYWGAAEENWYP